MFFFCKLKDIFSQFLPRIQRHFFYWFGFIVGRRFHLVKSLSGYINWPKQLCSILNATNRCGFDKDHGGFRVSCLQRLSRWRVAVKTVNIYAVWDQNVNDFIRHRVIHRRWRRSPSDRVNVSYTEGPTGTSPLWRIKRAGLGESFLQLCHHFINLSLMAVFV